MFAGDEQQQFEFLPACTPLHCTLGLTTHARHAALARDSDCLGLGRTLDTLLVCAWNPGCGLAGPSSKLTSSPSFPSLPFLPFPPLTLPKFTPMEFARWAILARLPGRQYQRDAFPNTTAHAHPFGSGTNPWPVLQQWPSSGGGQEETLLTLARCVYWNFFFLLLF